LERIGNGFRVVTRGVRPFIRASQIKFVGDGFRPNARLYTFFDRTAVSEFVTMTSEFTSEAADEGLTTASPGSSLITTAAGHVEGFLDIPDPTIAGNPQFSTGEVEFRLTTSTTDVRTTDPASSGNAYYQAKGLFEQTVDISLQLRPPPPPPPTNRSVGDGVRRPDGPPNDGGGDPLAQTFRVTEGTGNQNEATNEILGGCFLTSVDVFFAIKDENIPVTCEIRTTFNGFPSGDVLPLLEW
jgi:hypothetical protein